MKTGQCVLAAVSMVRSGVSVTVLPDTATPTGATVAFWPGSTAVLGARARARPFGAKAGVGESHIMAAGAVNAGWLKLSVAAMLPAGSAPSVRPVLLVVSRRAASAGLAAAAASW